MESLDIIVENSSREYSKEEKLKMSEKKNKLYQELLKQITEKDLSEEVKETLEKLSVVSMVKAKVLREGETKEIPASEIVLDDIIYLENGIQIMVDAEVVYSNGLEIDESMITGESDSISKKLKDNLYSGSFVVAGEGYALSLIHI